MQKVQEKNITTHKDSGKKYLTVKLKDFSLFRLSKS